MCINDKKITPPFPFLLFPFPFFLLFHFVPHCLIFHFFPGTIPPPLAIVFCTIYTPVEIKLIFANFTSARVLSNINYCHVWFLGRKRPLFSFFLFLFPIVSKKTEEDDFLIIYHQSFGKRVDIVISKASTFFKHVSTIIIINRKQQTDGHLRVT